MAQPGVITRSAHPSDLWPGIKAHFGLTYAKFPPKWSEIFEKGTSDKAYEKVVEATGFGLAPIKSEGSPIQFDTDAEGITSTFTHVVYALGYIVTEEELEDNQYVAKSTQRSTGLSFSMNTTAEIVHANILNRAFDTNYLGGDGVALISASHPSAAGLVSNLIPAADLSETSLEDGLKLMMQARNSRGLNIAVEARKLIVSTGDAFNAARILNSVGRVGTANNDLNAIKSMGSIPDVAVNPYLTDFDAWFLQTNVPQGLMSLWRREVELSKDSDFDTANAKAKASMRFSAGWGDFRSVFGSAGI